MPTAARSASSTAIGVAGSGAPMGISMPGIIAHSRNGGFGCHHSGRADDISRGTAEDTLRTGTEDRCGSDAIGNANHTCGKSVACSAYDPFVGTGHGVDGGTDRGRAAHTAVSSVEAGAAVQSVSFVFYRMRAVYRAGGGFASRGSLNPVRPWP